MERSFKNEVESLRLGRGQVFRGEGILAVTKALLQSGVSYVGGYQGAPVSQMMDVLNDAHGILDELGIHAEANASEASAAAMLGASINYPMRGAVAWKSPVGTNVASDALSNLASAGVMGGCLIIIGEDYGDGAAAIQERSHAFAMKSQIWLLDPRPSLPVIVHMVEKGFELSEASSTPVFLELRIRACHVRGTFESKDNQTPRISRRAPLERPNFDYTRVCMPPSIFAQEKHKLDVRLPAALEFIREHRLNEVFPGAQDDVGIICQGGLYNATMRALELMGAADSLGGSPIPVYCLNVTYPLVPEEIAAFCAGKRSVLVVEEGSPAYIEDAVQATLRRAAINGTQIHGKDFLPGAGEYSGEVMLGGMRRWLQAAQPRAVDLPAAHSAHEGLLAPKKRAAELLGEPVPVRLPSFCTGCPERPVFSAMKLLQRETGEFHVSADVGCHTMSTLAPFNMGNTVLGYGLGLASNAAIQPMLAKRSVSIMGDGGFWHNGLSSGVASAVFNQDDGILVIMKNGYTSATGTQDIPSSPHRTRQKSTGMSIERALKGLGVEWLRVVNNYRIEDMRRTLKEAMRTTYKGLKVVIAEGECQLERQRRLRPLNAAKLQAGERVVRERFGIDDDVCTGDHSCIRLSGCPSLTIKPNPDPLRKDPVAHVNNGCVGCGLCGEVAHAAVLCPSFYRAKIVHNPSGWDRFMAGLRNAVIGWLNPGSRAVPLAADGR
jgi:indolepyruvate ferredoxin oxidoreductase alpha subunit